MSLFYSNVTYIFLKFKIFQTNIEMAVFRLFVCVLDFFICFVMRRPPVRIRPTPKKPQYLVYSGFLC